MHWLKQLIKRDEMKSNLAEEIRNHLEEKVESLVAEGLNRKEAEHTARREFGNCTLLEERSRETWGWPALEFLLADVRYAIRRLIKTPAFTLVALLTLALGIGANTGIFTVLNAVLLKSLPVPAPEQLFLVRQSGRPAEKTRFSYPFFQRFHRQLPNSIYMAAMSWPDSFYVGPGAGPGAGPDETAMGQLVSGEYFRVFETYPVLGRLFTPEDEDKLSGSPIVVIGYGYWQRHLASDRTVIGRKLVVNHVPFTIVGVATQGFFGARPEAEPDFWMPLTMQSDVRYHSHYSDTTAADPSKPWAPQENINWLQFVVRVKDVAALPRFTALMNRLFHQDRELLIQHERDPLQQQALRRSYLTLEPGQQGFATLRREFEQPLFLLMGMALTVLLIACANIANLLLARAVARERAIAVQLSIGAGRSRLLRQILIESLLLSLGGGICGITVALWCARVLPKWASATDVAIPLNLVPDARVLFFSLSVALLTGVLFGLAPAWQSVRVDPVQALKANARGVHGSDSAGRWSLRKSLVVCQVALSLVLLVAAGMFLRTLTDYSKLDPGFDRDHLLSIRVDTHLVNYQPAELLSLYRRLVDSLNATPGVRSSSVASCALVVDCLDSSDVLLVDKRESKAQRVNAQVNSVSLDYFRTVGIQLVQGRSLRLEDNERSPKVALVNQTLANRFFKNGAALGRRFAYDLDSPQSFEIVGVVSDARVNNIRQTAPPLIYLSIAQGPGNIESIDLRTTADPRWLVEQARRAVLAVDSRLSIVDVNTLSELVDRNLTQQRLIARLTAMFGLLALGLACLGIYGVMSYTVGRRTGEIGVRLALGSSRLEMLWLVLKETLVLVAAGAAAGLVLSVSVMHLLTNFLFGVTPEDPQTITLAGALLLVVSVIAGFLPAWKAAGVDPIEALRFE